MDKRTKNFGNNRRSNYNCEIQQSSRVKKLEDLKQKSDSSVPTEERRRIAQRKMVKDEKKLQALEDLKVARGRKRKLVELDQQKDHSQKDYFGPTELNRKVPVKKSKFSEIYSDNDDSSGASHYNQREATCSGSQPDYGARDKSPFITTKEELSRIRLSRHKLEKWVYAPFFKETVTGCFVKVSNGFYCGKPVYKVAEIRGVVETAKIYQLGSLRTNIGLQLKHGIECCVYRLEFVSNQDFLDTEFSEWQKKIAAQGCALPTIEDINSKAADIQKALNHHYSEGDVESIVKQKRRFENNPHNYAREKSLLLRNKEVAEQDGNDEITTKFKEELTKLEEISKELDKQRTRHLTTVSNINVRNRHENFCGSQKAIKEEAKEIQSMYVFDPFTRRRCAPAFPKRSKPAAVAGISEKSEKPELEKQQEKHEMETDKLKKVASVPAERNGDPYDLYDWHNFEIDIDIFQ